MRLVNKLVDKLKLQLSLKRIIIFWFLFFIAIIGSYLIFNKSFYKIIIVDSKIKENDSQIIIKNESFESVKSSNKTIISNTSLNTLKHDLPNWEKYAVPLVIDSDRHVIAVIIDDMGLDKRRSKEILQLSGPLTVSFMSYADDLNRQTREASANGHELMMHIPMEPLISSLDAGPSVLKVNLSIEELKKRLIYNLNRFNGYVGINNHMGSKFTACTFGMQVLMDELYLRGVLFIDSLTTHNSVGLKIARKSGVPTAERNVFLDNIGNMMSINDQLIKLEKLAHKNGNAIAIGHPRDETIKALATWLPTLSKKGLTLVPISHVVKTRESYFRNKK
ncbi:MAG: divergent polysaccharide deacetylase family protein [Rhodospirillaceae bacterium]|nr:divergent polysaccharide deacetylase family protein [Rhodospirillaceae bacterium]